MLTLYQYPVCSTCKKAKNELIQLGQEFTEINIKETPPSASFLKQIIEQSGLPLKSYFNTSGQSYRALGLKDMFDSLTLDEAVKLLSSDGMLIKRPILLKDDRVLQVGYRKPYADLADL